MSQYEIRQSSGGRGSHTIAKADSLEEIAKLSVEMGGVDPEDLLEGIDGGR